MRALEAEKQRAAYAAKFAARDREQALKAQREAEEAAAHFAAHQARRFGVQQQHEQYLQQQQQLEHSGHMPLLPALVSESTAPDGEHRLLPRSASSSAGGIGTLTLHSASASGGVSAGGGISGLAQGKEAVPTKTPFMRSAERVDKCVPFMRRKQVAAKQRLFDLVARLDDGTPRNGGGGGTDGSGSGSGSGSGEDGSGAGDAEGGAASDADGGSDGDSDADA